LLDKIKAKKFVDINIYDVEDSCEPIAEHTNIELDCIKFSKIDGGLVCIVSYDSYFIETGENGEQTVVPRFAEHNIYPVDLTRMTISITEHFLGADDMFYGIATPSVIAKLLEIK
jgi:hypothetical protein